MEFCELTLESYLRSHQPLLQYLAGIQQKTKDTQIHNVLTAMNQITQGLLFIHRNHEVHRDLKPRNGITLDSFFWFKCWANV
jgi:serine/threonine protein kinase